MGKRIEDLDPYGSYDITKMVSDIFEVSKNSGTASVPVYDADGSRQIKLSELSALIGMTLPGGYIPLLGPNYLVVTLGTNVVSGTNLLAAIAYAKAATPNGSALSASNRFTVILFPGIYDLGATGITALGEFVDIVGVGEAKDIVITSSNATGTIGIADTSDYILKNLTINNTGAGGSITHGVTKTDNGTWQNLILNKATTMNTTYNGLYEKIDGKTTLILAGSISGIVRNSTFLANSCGYSLASVINISGTIENVVAGNFSCGNGGSVVISGKIWNVKTGSNSMGCSNINGTVEFTDTAIVGFCTGTNNNFGRTDGPIIINCKMIHCKSGGSSFGSTLADQDCTFNSSAHLIWCESGSRSFGYSTTGTMHNNGVMENCTATTESFGDTSATGKLINCSRTGGWGLHAGLIHGCDFSENSDTVPALAIAEGAVIVRSKFMQSGASYCVFGATINANITYCYMNKVLVGITNTSEPAFNIGDGFIPSYFIVYSPNGHRQKITVDNTSAVSAEDLDP